MTLSDTEKKLIAHIARTFLKTFPQRVHQSDQYKAMANKLSTAPAFWHGILEKILCDLLSMAHKEGETQKVVPPLTMTSVLIKPQEKNLLAFQDKVCRLPLLISTSPEHCS
jgi:hypothetical protein